MIEVTKLCVFVCYYLNVPLRIAYPPVMCAHMCSSKISSTRIGVAKLKSACGKDSEGICKLSNQQEGSDKYTVSMGTRWTSLHQPHATSSSMAILKKRGMQEEQSQRTL